MFFSSVSIKNAFGILDGDYIASIDYFWYCWYFNYINYSISWTWDTFPFICVFFDFFHECPTPYRVESSKYSWSLGLELKYYCFQMFYYSKLQAWQEKLHSIIVTFKAHYISVGKKMGLKEERERQLLLFIYTICFVWILRIMYTYTLFL